MDPLLKSQMADSAVARLFNENKNSKLQILNVLKILQGTLKEHKDLSTTVSNERAAHNTQMEFWNELATRLSEVVDFYEKNAGEHLSLMDQTKDIVSSHAKNMEELQGAISHTKSLKPKAGKPGKDAAPVDIESIISSVIQALRSEQPKEFAIASPIDTEALYKEILGRIIKEKAIDVSNIRNSEQFMFGKKKYGVAELMHGSGASSGPSGNSVYNEVVSGSGTAWTLVHVPVLGTVRLFGEGQKLLPTSNYTITGSTITTSDSWPAGAISADYNF